MSRLIDADDIDYESIDSSDTNRYEYYYGTGIMAVRKEDIDAMPTIEPELRWIPCSERLPEESRTYTVTAYDGATERVTYAKYQKRLKRWELTGARAYWRVLAWLPLPEPWKGE